MLVSRQWFDVVHGHIANRGDKIVALLGDETTLINHAIISTIRSRGHRSSETRGQCSRDARGHPRRAECGSATGPGGVGAGAGSQGARARGQRSTPDTRPGGLVAGVTLELPTIDKADSETDRPTAYGAAVWPGERGSQPLYPPDGGSGLSESSRPVVPFVPQASTSVT